MAAALGFVYNVTKEPIEQAAKDKEISAIKEVIPAFENDIVSTAKEIDGLTIYTAIDKGNIVGYAIKTYTDKGYSGRFDLMVGFLSNGSINNIVVLQQKETPGLGSNMSLPKFRDQFISVNISNLADQKLKVKKDGGTIDAISAATISSRAYCDGIQKAFDVLKNNYLNANIAQTSNDSLMNNNAQPIVVK